MKKEFDMKKFILKQWYPSLDNDFGVGDIVFYDKERGCYAKPNNRDTVLRKREVENNPGFWELIEEEEKPKPLFITEDGVECFENDKYILIGIGFEKNHMIATKRMLSKGMIRFKHESNADEYIAWYKKEFSINDLLLADIGITTNQLDKLHEIAIKKNIING